MSMELVRQVKAELEAKGVYLLGPCGAFQITRRVAWQLRSAGYKLLGGKNPAQNGCAVGSDKYSVDVLMRFDPDGWKEIDILGNAGGDPNAPNEPANVPRWNVEPAHNPALAREPIDPGDVPTPPAEPPVEPPAPLNSLGPVLAELAELRAAYEALSARVLTLERQLPPVLPPRTTTKVN